MRKQMTKANYTGCHTLSIKGQRKVTIKINNKKKNRGDSGIQIICAIRHSATKPCVKSSRTSQGC